jgi:hypothetical protein
MARTIWPSAAVPTRICDIKPGTGHLLDLGAHAGT